MKEKQTGVTEMMKTTPKKASDWINKYVKGYKEKKLSIKQILEAENAIRASTKLLKYTSVKRMLNQAGFSVSKTEAEKSKTKALKAEMVSSVAKLKPCITCKYHVRDMCVCPRDLFEHYTTLNDFYQDLSGNQCKLKRLLGEEE